MFIAFITCQYVPHKLKGKKHELVCVCYTVFFTVGIGSIVNIWPTVMILFDWIACPVQYFDVCYTLLLYNDTRPTAEFDTSNIVLLSTTSNPSNNISNINTADELKRFIEYEKLVLLFSAVSGTISYIFFIYCVLCRLYITKVYLNEQAQDGFEVTQTEENTSEMNTPEMNTSVEDTFEEDASEEDASEEDASEEDTAESTRSETTSPQVTPAEDTPDEHTPGVIATHQATDNKIPPSPLHPFDDNDINNIQTGGENGNNTSTSTQLDEKESFIFWLFLLLSIALLVGMCIVFFIHYNKRHPLSQEKDNIHITYRYNVTTIVGFEIVTAVAYFYSLFCTISSCFIFSKVMYGIQNQCKDLFKVEKEASKFIKEDKKFTEVAIETQRPFEMWFFIHWVMYIITSFLSLSFLFEAINKKIQASLVTLPPDSGIAFHDEELILIALLAASNSFFFLYPCIRAAGVTESRKRLIREVNESIDFNFENNIKNDIRRAFVNYLKEKNYGFRLNILCAHVKFNLNIAYISIFIGLLGVLIKVGSSI